MLCLSIILVYKIVLVFILISKGVDDIVNFIKLIGLILYGKILYVKMEKLV